MRGGCIRKLKWSFPQDFKIKFNNKIFFMRLVKTGFMIKKYANGNVFIITGHSIYHNYNAVHVTYSILGGAVG